MTYAGMIKAIKAGNITENLENALIEFYWEFDPYGIMDNYGHLNDNGVRSALLSDILYVLHHDPETIIEDIKSSMEV